MRYKNLGNTGLIVSELCLGAMVFGGKDGIWDTFGALNQQQSTEMIRTAVDAGINFIDTADAYAEGASEEITGQAIRDLGIPRDEIVIATKVFGPTGAGPNNRGNSRGHIQNAVKASLKRLQTDYIDLYQIHGFDPLTPIEETMYALDALVQQGHVRYIGVSNWTAWQIMKALGLSDRYGLPRFASLQAYYTVAGRDLEREITPMLQSENVGLMIWSPLAGGLLSGKYNLTDTPATEGRRLEQDFPPVNRERASEIIETMRPMAEERSISVAQIALAWLLHQPVVTSVIVGAKRIDQLIDNLAATKVSLSKEELSLLDSVSTLPSEYPGWMLDFLGAVRDNPNFDEAVNQH